MPHFLWDVKKLSKTLADRIKLAALHGIAPPRVSRVFCVHMQNPKDKTKDSGCCGKTMIYCAHTGHDQKLNLCGKCPDRKQPKT